MGLVCERVDIAMIWNWNRFQGEMWNHGLVWVLKPWSTDCGRICVYCDAVEAFCQLLKVVEQFLLLEPKVGSSSANAQETKRF